jgi:hypothetical protein
MLRYPQNAQNAATHKTGGVEAAAGTDGRVSARAAFPDIRRATGSRMVDCRSTSVMPRQWLSWRRCSQHRSCAAAAPRSSDRGLRGRAIPRSVFCASVGVCPGRVHVNHPGWIRPRPIRAVLVPLARVPQRCCTFGVLVGGGAQRRRRQPGRIPQALAVAALSGRVACRRSGGSLVVRSVRGWTATARMRDSTPAGVRRRESSHESDRMCNGLGVPAQPRRRP